MVNLNGKKFSIQILDFHQSVGSFKQVIIHIRTYTFTGFSGGDYKLYGKLKIPCSAYKN